MSLCPEARGRVEKKYSVVPCRESQGEPSSKALLTGLGTSTGVGHGSESASRVDVQMSIRPCPPVRSDVMNASRPSFLMKMRVSRLALLNSGTSTPGPKYPSSPRGLAQTSKPCEPG